MKNFTQELKDIIKEDPGRPILSPDEVRGRASARSVDDGSLQAVRDQPEDRLQDPRAVPS